MVDKTSLAPLVVFHTLKRSLDSACRYPEAWAVQAGPLVSEHLETAKKRVVTYLF